MSSAASDLVGNLSTLEDFVKMIDVLTMEKEMLCLYMCTHLEEAAETHMNILTMENEILCICLNNHLEEAVSYFEKEEEKHSTRKRDLEVERRNCETMKRNFDEEKEKQETLKRKFDDEKREQENLKRKFEQEKREQQNLIRKFEDEKREQENLKRKFEEEHETLKRKFEQEKREQENLKRKFEEEQETLKRKFEQEKREQQNLIRKLEDEKGEQENLKIKFDEEHETLKRTKTHFENEFNLVAKTNENLLRQNERLRAEANNNQLDRCAIGFIPVYFLIATTFCYYNRHNFKGMKMGSVFTILYYVVVVTLSVGYGDLVPNTLGTKLFTCLLVAIGGQVSQCLISLQLSAWRKVKDMFPQIISETGRKVLTFCLALIAIMISVLVGMLGFLYFENGKGVGKSPVYNLNVTDAFYASLVSLTTVGFGDYSFKTEHGRVFAVFWLLICVPMYVSALTHVVRVIVSATGCFYSF